MDDTYTFEDHLREHRLSRLGQRLWRVLAVVGVAVAVEGATYLAVTRSGHPSAVLAISPLAIAGLLFLFAAAALSIADWTYPSEKRYQEARHAANSQALAYILAGRRTREPRVTPPEITTGLVFAASASPKRRTPTGSQHPAPQTASR